MTGTPGVDVLADALLEVIAEEDPLDDALEGYPGIAHLLGDPSAAAGEALVKRARGLVADLPRASPAASVDLTRELILQQAESLVTRRTAALLEFTVADYQTSPLGRLLGALPEVRPAGEAQVRGFLQRLAGIPGYLRAAAQRHCDGVAAGRVPVAGRVRAAVARLDRYLADPADDPLLTPPLDGRAAAEREDLLTDVVRPAFAAYRDVLATDIAPRGRLDSKPGLCWLPGGEQTYLALCRMHTTTSLSPADLHHIGQQVVAELDQECEAIGGPLFGVGTAAAVRRRLRTDPALRWGSGEELVAAMRDAVARAEQVCPSWFTEVPAAPCVVSPAPQPGAPGAYYLPAALDGGRPGAVYVNTHQATGSNRAVAQALAFHEAVPGHHVQLTFARELPGVPQLRRLAWINSYIEGWGLYAERLAGEMGLYSDALSRLGMIAMDSFRAARLVVDTGLHAFGWSRQAAVAYLREATVLEDAEVEREVDRYIDMPGQALSYLVGRLELQRIRDEAAQRLGSAFTLATFHDVVLGGGTLPLGTLADVVTAWADRTSGERGDGQVQ